MSFQVEGTNDSSCLSKYSMAKQGYFDDDYLVYFVSKQPRRSPLIHIGYYVRATVISSTLKEFCDKLSKQVAQIISFGAGFDTSFFRLSGDKNKNIIYYEIDFPRVVTRKIQCIRGSDCLKRIIGDFKVTEYGLSSNRYHLLCADLRDVESVETQLSEAGVSLSLPTLFLSECAITYLEETKSDNLIQWATKFANATFVTYEQIEPEDGFGIVMLQHFESLNTPLQSVRRYPSLLDQQNRYKKLGWKECISIPALDAYFNVTGPEEYARVTRLELFDEWEEFHLKCCHYSLVIASQGSLTNWLSLCRVGVHSGLASVCKTILWNLIDCGQAQIFGHCSVLSENGNGKTEMYIIGGFGCDEQGAHRRNKHAFILTPKDCFTGYTMGNKCNCDDKEFSFEVMYATLTLYTPSDTMHQRMILYGGRTSPQKCVNVRPAIVEVDCSGHVRCQPLVSGTCTVVPRWRHSSVIAKHHGSNMFVVFGGCTKNRQVLGDAWKINLNTDLSKRTVLFLKETHVKPCARFSHSAAVMITGSDCDTVLISGGLDDSLKPLNDIWELDMKTEQWKIIDIAGILPRYGHTSHVVNSTLILVGGVNTLTGQQPGICVVDLQRKTCTELQLPTMNPEKPVMLINHNSTLLSDKSSILVVGGGGNCFSFGTFFNSYIVQIDLNQFNII